jgi:hypothetical protein
MQSIPEYKDIIQVRNLKDERDFMIFGMFVTKTQLILP